MPDAFTHYWRNETWEQEMLSGRGSILEHIADNSFSTRGVAPGDSVFIVTNLLGQLFLGGRIIVERIVDQQTAETVLKRSVWSAKEHIITGHPTRMRFDRKVPIDIARQLRFGDGTAALVFDSEGRLDHQTIRGVRKLSPSAASLLDALLIDEGESVPTPPFVVGQKYTRQDIYKILSVPQEQQRGDWDTGYHKYRDAWYLFPTIGAPGRTGHDYENRWIGDDLYWKGKTNSKLDQNSIQSMLGGALPVHIFTREHNRDPFTYEGVARPIRTEDTVPVVIVWAFGNVGAKIEPGELTIRTYLEGAVKTILVDAYERNPHARRKCIHHYGCICQVCGMDFEHIYGPIGKGYIHVHHLRSVASIGQEYLIDPVIDLRPVCPNCHAMIHRTEPPMTIDALKALVAKKRILPLE